VPKKGKPMSEEGGSPKKIRKNPDKNFCTPVPRDSNGKKSECGKQGGHTRAKKSCVLPEVEEKPGGTVHYARGVEKKAQRKRGFARKVTRVNFDNRPSQTFGRGTIFMGA